MTQGTANSGINVSLGYIPALGVRGPGLGFLTLPSVMLSPSPSSLWLIPVSYRLTDCFAFEPSLQNKLKFITGADTNLICYTVIQDKKQQINFFS